MHIDNYFIGGNFLVIHLPNAFYKTPMHIVQSPVQHFLREDFDSLHLFLKSMLDTIEQCIVADVWPIEVANPVNWLYKVNEKKAFYVAPHFLVDDFCRLESLKTITMTFDNQKCSDNVLVK